MNRKKRNLILYVCLSVVALPGGIFIGMGMPPKAEETGGSVVLIPERTRKGALATSLESERPAVEPRVFRETSRSFTTGSSANAFMRSLRDLDRDAENGRLSAVQAIIDQLGPEDFLPMARAFQDAALNRRQKEYGLFLTAWAEVNPGQAMNYLTQDGAGTDAFANDVVLSTWAAYDAGAAYDWATANHVRRGLDWENPYLSSVIKVLAASDLPRATEMLDGMSWSGDGGRIAKDIAERLVKEDPEKAKAWTETIPLEGYNWARRVVASRLLYTDPGDAARWLTGLGDTETLLKGIIGTGEKLAALLAAGWYEQSPGEALEWVQSLESKVMVEAAGGVIQKMVKKDPAQAAAWLSQLRAANPEVNFSASMKLLSQALPDGEG